jgi:hypothetical protein
MLDMEINTSAVDVKFALRITSMDDSTLCAIWVVDSETGERKLLDLRTGKDITPRDS